MIYGSIMKDLFSGDLNISHVEGDVKDIPVLSDSASPGGDSQIQRCVRLETAHSYMFWKSPFFLLLFGEVKSARKLRISFFFPLQWSLKRCSKAKLMDGMGGFYSPMSSDVLQRPCSNFCSNKRSLKCLLLLFNRPDI